MTEVAKLVIAVDSRGAKTATHDLLELERVAGMTEKQANQMGLSLGKAMAAISTGVSVGQFVKMADAWANMSGRLRMATDSAEAFSRAQSEISRIANATGNDLEGVADLYTKLANSSSRLRSNQELLIDVTENVSKALSLSGADTAAAASVIRQFSQAMASGTLRGDEFISVMEGAPRLAQAIADGMGEPREKLRELAQQGKLTAETVVAALKTQKDVLEAEYSQMPLTVGKAFQEMQNEVLKWVGSADQASGASAALAKSMSAVASNLDGLLTIGGAAGIGVLAGKIGQMGMAAARTATEMLHNRTATVAQVTAARDATLAAHLSAQAEVRRAQAAMTAARGTDASAAATARYASALLAERNAAAAATAAQLQYSRSVGVANVAKSAAIGLLGGPVGLAATAGIAAASMLIFRDNTGTASESLIDLNSTVDEAVAKFRELGKAQQEVEKLNVESSIEDAGNKLRRATAQITGHQNLHSLSHEIHKITEAFENGAISAEEGSSRITRAIAKIKPYSEGIRQDLIKLGGEWETQARQIENGREKLEGMRKAQDGVAQSTQGMTNATSLQSAATGKATEEWDKYVAKLHDAVDVIGLSAKQLGEYRARQAGFSEEQIQMAGLLSEKAEQLRAFQQAVQSNDREQAEAARKTLVRLAQIEDSLAGVQRTATGALGSISATFNSMWSLSALAAKMGVKHAEPTPLDPRRQRSWVMADGEAPPVMTAQSDLQKQIDEILENRTKGKSGSGRARKASSDFADWTRQMQESITLQEALAVAYGKGEAAVASATLAHEAELLVLKHGAAKRAEITALVEREARLKAEVHGAQTLANLEREIELYGQTGRAAVTAYDLAKGALANLDEQQKKNIQSAADYLDFLEDLKIHEAAVADVQRELAGRTKTATDEMNAIAEQAARNIQDLLGNAMFDVLDGKFSDIGDSFANMLKRMAAELAASKLLELLGGAMAGYKGKGGWGDLVRSIGGSLGGKGGGGYGGGRAMGGPVAGGRLYEVGEGGRPELFEQNGRTFLIPGNNGRVTPASRGGGGSMPAPRVTVNIHNAPQGADVQQRQGPDGGLDIDVIFRQLEGRMASNLADGSSPIGAAMKGRYGLREVV